MNRRRFVTLLFSVLVGGLAACRKRMPGKTPVATERPAATGTVASIPSTPTPGFTPAPMPSPEPTPSPAPSPTPTPAPVEVQVWIDPALPDDLIDAAHGLVPTLRQEGQKQGIKVLLTSDEARADLRLTVQPSTGQQVEIARAPRALVTSPRVPLRSITAAQAAAIMSGSVSNWADVGSPKSIPVSVVSIGSNPDLADSNQVASYDELVNDFIRQPGAVALLPVAEADYRVRALVIDEIDIIAQPEKASSYALQQSLYLEPGAAASSSAAALLSSVTLAKPASVPIGRQRSVTTVTIVGDIILGRTVNKIMTEQNDFAAPFRLVADELKQADLTIGDLECSLSDTIAPPSDPFTFLFITRATAVEGLTLAGIDGVSQANNHSMNFGVAGMHDTLDALDKAGIRHFGIGDNLDEARKPGVFEVNGIRIAFLGYDGITGNSYGAGDNSAGTSPLVTDNLVADIAAARQQADLVIPFMHWSIEYTLTPTQAQRAIARQAIAAGADLVVGSHPHWVQGMEIYQGKPIVYSLANFVFDQDWSEETKQGLILHLTFQGTTLVALRFVPVYIEGFYRPRIVDGAELVTILDRVWASTDEIAAMGEP